MRPRDIKAKSLRPVLDRTRQDRESYRIMTSLFMIRIQQLHATQNVPRMPHLLNVSLSLNGIGFRDQYPLKVHQWVLLEYALPTEPEWILHAQARVVHTEAMEDGTYQAGLCFEWMSAEDRDRLRQYCQAEQRSLLRQRLEEEGF